MSTESWEVGEKEQDRLPSAAAWRTSQTSCKDTPVNFFTCSYLAVSEQIVSAYIHKALLW